MRQDPLVNKKCASHTLAMSYNSTKHTFAAPDTITKQSFPLVRLRIPRKVLYPGGMKLPMIETDMPAHAGMPIQKMLLRAPWTEILSVWDASDFQKSPPESPPPEAFRLP